MKAFVIRVMVGIMLCTSAVATCAFADSRFTKDSEKLDFAAQLSSQLQYTQAAVVYEDFIQQYPQSPFLPQAYIGAGDSYFFIKEFDKAIEFYQSYKRQFPQGKDTWFVLLREGQCLYLSGKIEQSLAKLTALDSNRIQKPFLQTFYFYLAQAQMAQGYVKEAGENFEKSVQAQTSGGYTAQVYLQWASLLAKQGDANGAFEKYAKAMDVGNSEEIKIQMKMRQGLAYLNSKGYERAIIIFQEILDGYPSEPVGKNAAVNLFIALLKAGQNDRIISEYERFKNDFDDPLLVPVYQLAIEAFIRRQKYDEALGIANRLIKSVVLSQKIKNEAVVQQIRILNEAGKFTEALDLIDTQTALASQIKPTLMLLKAQSYLGLKDYDQAWEIYASIAKGNPDIATTYCGMAHVRHAEGQEAQAASLFMECFNKSKDEFYRQEALYSAFLMYKEVGMTKNILETAKSYQTSYPQGQHFAEISFNLADFYSKNQQYDKAVDVLKNLPGTSSYVDQREAVFQAAYNLQLSGKTQEALNLYNIIINQNTDPQLTLMATKNSAIINSGKNMGSIK